MVSYDVSRHVLSFYKRRVVTNRADDFLSNEIYIDSKKGFTYYSKCKIESNIDFLVDTNRQTDGNNTFEQFDENHDFDQIDGSYTLENYMEKGLCWTSIMQIYGFVQNHTFSQPCMAPSG